MISDFVVKIILFEKGNLDLFYQIEDAISQILEENGLGEVTGHEIENEIYRVFLTSNIADEEASKGIFFEISKIPFPKGSEIIFVNPSGEEFVVKTLANKAN